MSPAAGVEFVGVVVTAPDVAAAAREFAQLLGASAPPTDARFDLPRGTIRIERDAATALRALVFRGAPPAPPFDSRGLDVRFEATADAATSASPEFLGIDHVVVHTTDPDAGIALWRDGLGIRLALDRTFPDFGMRLVFLRSGGITIELACPIAPPATREPDRLYGLSFKVADVVATRARLLHAGLDVSEIRPGRKAGTRVATVRTAPLGIPTLLVEPPARRVTEDGRRSEANGGRARAASAATTDEA
jgi:catechol 2,3-dioxygenase-like lactoylglutathione lyase family enzyme